MRNEGLLTVRVKDNGFDALMLLAKDLNKPRTLTVGVHETANGRSKDGVPVVEYAGYNEFGTSRIPARSFLRGWFDEFESEIEDRLKKTTQNAISGKLPYAQGLKQLGALFVGQIRERISNGIEHAPWAYRTARGEAHAHREGHTPLIDQGILRANVEYELK